METFVKRINNNNTFLKIQNCDTFEMYTATNWRNYSLMKLY